MTEPSKTARSVGETLRHAREDLNLTIEQASRALHIRIRFLEALEASDIRALPSLAQSRGFLRMYAEYLGLDPAPLLARWLPVDKLAATAPEKPVSQATGGKPGFSILRLVDRVRRPAAGAVKPEEHVEIDESQPRSTQLFQTIAQKLVRQRETLEMSLEELALYSKIKIPTLQLLETMDMEALPSPVIVRGLLLNYAGALQMDQEEVLSIYAEALQARRDERNAALQQKRHPTAIKPVTPLVSVNTEIFKKIDIRKLGARLYNRFPFLRKYMTFDLLAGSILVIALAIVIIWAASSTLSQATRLLASQATLPGRSDILSSGSTLATQAELLPAITSTPESAQATSPVNGAANSSGPSGATVQTNYLVTLPANADAAFRVTIRPLQTVFVQIWVDDRLAFRGRMAPGADYPFNARRRVELLTGDAGGLQIFFNTTDLGIIGISGEVVHIVYTVRGAQTITPTVTSTFTPTPRPTLTPRPSATPRPTTTKKPTLTPTE